MRPIIGGAAPTVPRPFESATRPDTSPTRVIRRRSATDNEKHMMRFKPQFSAVLQTLFLAAEGCGCLAEGRGSFIIIIFVQKQGETRVIRQNKASKTDTAL